MKIKYKFKSSLPIHEVDLNLNLDTGDGQVHTQFGRSMEYEDSPKWETIRYLLEKQIGIHGDSYLEAYYESDSEKPLQPGDDIDPTQILVLKRIPLDGLMPYIPRPYQYHMPMPNPPPTENESIEDFVKKSTDTFTKYMKSKQPRFAFMHASEIKKRQLTKPHEGYVCHCCGDRGSHYRKDCPLKDDPHFIPLIKRGTPKGIPKSKLKLATTDAEKDRAYINDKGQYVLWKI